MEKNNGRFNVVLERRGFSLNEIKLFAITLIIGIALGFSGAYFWPSPDNKDIDDFVERVSDEKDKLKAIKIKHSHKKIKIEKDIVILKRKAASVLSSNLTSKIKSQALVIEKQALLIDSLKKENKDLYSLIDEKTATQLAQIKVMNDFNKTIAKERGKSKILMGSTIGLAVTTAVGLAFGVGMVYFKK